MGEEMPDLSLKLPKFTAEISWSWRIRDSIDGEVVHRRQQRRRKLKEKDEKKKKRKRKRKLRGNTKIIGRLVDSVTPHVALHCSPIYQNFSLDFEYIS